MRIQKRVNELHKQNFHVEAVILHGQAIEHALKEIFYNFRAKREIMDTLALTDPHADIVLSDKEINRNLGVLIGKLRGFTGETDLVKELEYFNTNFRKHFVHHAFFTTDEMFREKQLEAIAYLTSAEKMGKLVRMLSDERKRVMREAEDLYPHVSAPDGTRPIS